MKTWADVAGINPPSKSVDRDKGEGPTRCCKRRLIAADGLVYYGDAAPERLALIVQRLPHLAGVSNLFLCDGCADLIVRERIITHEERATDLGLSAAHVDKARAHDRKLGFTKNEV